MTFTMCSNEQGWSVTTFAIAGAAPSTLRRYCFISDTLITRLHLNAMLSEHHHSLPKSQSPPLAEFVHPHLAQTLVQDGTLDAFSP